MITSREATLPIGLGDGITLDASEAHALGVLLADDYRTGDPFPHIVIDSFLPDALIRRVRSDFPSEQLKSDVVFDIGYGGHHKRQILPDECNGSAREFFAFMNSRAMLQFLEGLTGIDGLIPDPYFTGGGFHEIAHGGKLGVHADFRINDQLHLQRRLNLLIYLNEEWSDEWRGHLELWDTQMTACRARIAPIWNRCVVFSTGACTWHGHPDELLTPPGVMRRSVALYYYTASKAVYDEIPDRSTMYEARPGDPESVHGEAKRLRASQYLRDYLPPVALRALHRLGRAIRRLRSGGRAAVSRSDRP
jgi:2OG-Fe(II) oxygenase superfamily